jgi:DNA topoisomerase VI subunit B
MQDCATLRNALRKRNDELPGVSNGMQRHENLCKPLSLNYETGAASHFNQPTAPTVLPKTGAASNIARVPFTTSRELEFFTESELTTQIGYRKGLWPIVLIKELIDNAIDACETTATGAIEIVVQLAKDSISVSDNGPGLSGKIIKGVVDYRSRISDKKHYIAPTRGQLGNALKCVVAAALVATGETSLIEIASRGRRHMIEIQLDRIAQKPKIAYTTTSEPSGVGTFLQVHWPGVASYFQSDGHDLYQFDNLDEAVDALIEDYLAFNPHASFTFNGKRRPATDPSWQKWQTDHPTSAHWYRDADLRGLIAAHITERDMPVRDFISNFAGLARNRVRADVLTAARIKGTHLSDLVRGGDVDMAAVRRLLVAMQEHSKPVQPKRLGIIGEDHLKRYFESLGANNLKYYRKAFIDNDGLPVVLEIAFATKPDAGESSRRIFGLNWSPVFKIPSGEIGEAISGCQVESDDPVILLIHAACPRFEFTDHGKGAIA